MEGLHYFQVRFTPYEPLAEHGRGAENAERRRQERQPHSKASAKPGESLQPPGYYVLETIPFAFGGSNILTKCS